MRGFVIPENASKLYLRWSAFAHRYGNAGTQALARDQYAYLCYDQSSPPSDVDDSWGTYHDMIIFASGTAHSFERVEKFDAPSEGNFYFAIYGEPSMNASGASLCGLSTPPSWLPYSASEEVGWSYARGKPPWPSLIEMNYTKS